MYNSDDTSHYIGSTSAAITQTVSKLTPVFSNLAKSQTITAGNALVLGGMIKAGNAVPSGFVLIALNDVQKSVAIGGDGSFSQGFDSSNLVPGSYKATYSFASSDFVNSVLDNTTTTITVAGLIVPNVLMQASPNPVLLGDTVTLTATVSQTGGIVSTGSVTFSENVDTQGGPLYGGAVNYGSANLVNGTATLTITQTSTPALIAGTHVMVATYSGDGGVSYSSAVSPLYTLTVDPNFGAPAPTPGFTLTMANGINGTVTVAQGVSASFPMSLTPAAGFTRGVALTCTPADAVSTIGCSISPALVTLSNGSQTVTVTITTVNASAKATQKMAFLLAGLALLPLAFKRRRAVASLLLLLVMATIASTGCAGGGSVQNLQFASPGTYHFTITASSTSGTPATSSVDVSVIVK